MMKCGVWNVSSIVYYPRLIDIRIHLEALQRIVGVVPAFMRPRESSQPCSWC